MILYFEWIWVQGRFPFFFTLLHIGAKLVNSILCYDLFQEKIQEAFLDLRSCVSTVLYLFNFQLILYHVSDTNLTDLLQSKLMLLTWPTYSDASWRSDIELYLVPFVTYLLSYLVAMYTQLIENPR